MAKKATPTFREIIADIRKGRPAPVYILHGEEPYYIDAIMDALESCVIEEEDRDFNQTVFYGAESVIDVVVAAAQQFPVMAQRRLVLLKEAQSMSRAKASLDKLEGYMLHPTGSTVLAIAFKGDSLGATSKLIKAAKEMPGAVIFSSPKLREWNLAAPVKDYCQSRRIGIDEKAVEMLTQFIGADLTALFAAIDKLIIAGGKDLQRISPADIERNIGISKDYNTFELTEAVASKNYSKAMLIAEYFSRNPNSNPTPVIFTQLFNYFSRLMLAHMTTDKSDASLMEVTQAKSAYQLKEVRKGLANYSPAATIQAISALRRADAESKGIGSYANQFDILKELIFRLFTAR